MQMAFVKQPRIFQKNSESPLRYISDSLRIQLPNSIKNETKEPNEAMERSRLPVTISAISVLRTGTNRASQPARSS